MVIKSDELVPNPVISVTVLTYNQENYVARCLDSILSQKCSVPFELIVSDDASTDGTRDILLDYQKRYPEIICLQFQEKNRGILGNEADVRKLCRGEYSARCDGDDYWCDPLKLQKQFDVMCANPEVGVVYSDAAVHYAADDSMSERIAPDPADDLFTQLLIGNSIPALSVMYWRSLQQYVDVEEFDKLGYCVEDYPMWLEFSNRCKFYHIKERLIIYEVDKKEHVSLRTALQQSIDFDKSATQIRLDYKRKFPDNTPLTEQDLLNAHYRRGIKYGLHLQDRLWVAGYLDKIVGKTRYEKALSLICKSEVLFKAYQRYRKGKGIESDLNGLVYA